MNEFILGIDLGTSGCKAVLFNRNFQIVSSAQTFYDTQYPSQGWAEQKPDDWWKAFKEALKDVLNKSGIKPSEIAGIAFDTMSPVVLPVGNSGEALRPAMIWMDRRAVKQAQWLKTNLQEEILRINGNLVDPSFMASKVLWIKENEPEIYKKTKYFMHANGYMVYRLTGKFSMDRSQGGLSQLYDTRKGEWSDELIKACGFDMSQMPPMMNCFDIAGKISADGSKETGLSEGTPVAAGSMDNVAAGLGAGACLNGDVYISAGTVTNAGVCINKPVYKKEMLIYHHIIPGLWLSVGGVDYGGAGLKWFKELLDQKDYSEITAGANESFYNEAPMIFLPYMVGQRAPVWNNNTRGVLFGINPSTNRKNMIRAIMEGTAFGTRNILEIAEKENISIGKIRMTGGCTNITSWIQAFSDISGKNIDVPGEMDVAPLGAAMTAAYGTGLYNSFTEMVSKIPVAGSFSPIDERKAYYDEMYTVFKKLFTQAEPVYQMLAEINNKFGV